MAYYYCYQQQAQPESQPPQSTAPELNTPLPSFLLLSPAPQQHLSTLPLLTPILPSVSITTTVATPGYNEQQQLPTPNTFIRHCEDMGLFHDLQNVIVMSPLTRQFDNTATTAVTASPIAVTTANTSRMFTDQTIPTSTSTENPSSSNSLGSLSTTVLKTMMMANPFDETFKQAILQQQNKDTNPVGNRFNNNNGNNDEELNTPFIVTSTDSDTTKINNCRSANEETSVIVTASSTVEPRISSVEPKQQSINIVPSKTEVSKLKAPSSVLVAMVEQKNQQKPYSTVSSQNQLQNNYVSKNRIIAPATSVAANCECQNLNNNVGSDENSNKFISIGSESTKVKQVLKQNLLEKQMLHEQPRPPILFKTFQPENNGVDIVSTTTVEQDDKIRNNTDEIQNNQMLVLRKKQELLERNRTAAKRSRLKRKESWKLLSEENRRLKIENIRLHKIISKLVESKT